MVEKVSRKQGIACVFVVAVATVGIWYLLNRRTEVPDIPVAGEPAASGLPSVEPPTSGGPPPAVVPQTPAEVTTPPVVRSSKFKNTELNAAYVGSESCVKCHQDEHQTYLRTAHSRSLREVNPELEPPDGELDDPVSGRSYKVYREADKLHHRETLRIGGDEELELADHAVKYAVGSGDHALTFLVETADGFLAESPVSWYASRKLWAMSPGFENYNTGFARPVYAECLFCHAGRVEAIGGNRSRIAMHAMAIDCERCHGPGSLHVATRGADAAAEPAADIDLTIVNPDHLSRQQNESIWPQCHLDSAAEVDVRGRSIRDFRPGQSMEDFRVHYALQIPSTDMKVVGHIEQLHLSNCYRGSETLTCSTCHESHGARAAADQLDFYRDKCLACHSQQPCGLPDASRLKKSPQDDCMACHMPSSSTDIPHVAATHHRIGIHNETPPAARPPIAGELIPLGDISHLSRLDQDRGLGLGYLDVSLDERDPQLSEAYRVRARETLEDVKTRGLEDPIVDAALARIYQRENPPKSIVLAESALQSPSLQADTRTQALFSLSTAYLSLKQAQLAIEPLEQLVELRRQAGDWFLLGVCRLQAGDFEAALKAAHRAAEIRPDKPNHQALLAELYRQSGQNDLAEKHEQRAKQLAGPRPEVP